MLSEVAVQVADNPQGRRAVNAAAQCEYARLARMSEATLTAAMEPYLPIARVQAPRAASACASAGIEGVPCRVDVKIRSGSFATVSVKIVGWLMSASACERPTEACPGALRLARPL
jgi:hypothetical protein